MPDRQPQLTSTFFSDLICRKRSNPKPLSICGLAKQKTEFHPTKLHQWFHIISIIKRSPRQTFALSIWGTGGPVAVVYKLPVHSLPGSQPACSPRCLSQVRVKVRSHTMDCSWIWREFFFFFLLFPRRLLRDLLQRSVLRGTSFFWRGLDVGPPFMSVLIVPQELMRQPGFGRWQKGMCSIPREHTLAHSHMVLGGNVVLISRRVLW